MNGRAEILLVDNCRQAGSLSRYEFVHPVQRALERAGASCRTCHYTLLDRPTLEGCDKVLLCGTALKDKECLNHLDRYSWLREWTGPVLGICTGMQIIAAAFGGGLLPRSEPAIGLDEIQVICPSPFWAPAARSRSIISTTLMSPCRMNFCAWPGLIGLLRPSLTPIGPSGG